MASIAAAAGAKAGIPHTKILRKGKQEDSLSKEIKTQAKAQAAEDKETDFQKDASLKNKVISIANPLGIAMKATNLVTGMGQACDAAPLYFPGAKSAPLRKHANVRFEVFRVESPEDVSDPLKIIFELDLSSRKLSTSNPLNPNKLAKTTYHMKDLDMDVWENEGNFGIWIVEKVTSCFCMISGIERDYVFANKEDRSRFCSLIHSVIANVLPVSAIPEMSSTPKSVSPPVRIFVSTWNMGNDDWGENFDEWIPNDGSLDLIVIGTQESKLGAGDKTGQMGNGARDWFKALSKAIGDDYVAVAKRNMFQNYLFVAVKKELATSITHVETFQAEQGIANVWGNKGGTAVAMRLNGQKVAFVNCHLAAHAEKVAKRIENIKNIIKDVHFGRYNQVEFATQYTVFWCGDLNFRVDMDMAECVKLVGDGELAKVAEEDQLVKEMKKGLFHGFLEGELSFIPTYKFDPMASPPDVRRPYSDYKARTPSWTDRVLVKPLDGHEVSLVEYNSAVRYVTSDHEPVYATYDFMASPLSTGGNFRRFLLIITKLSLSDLLDEEGEPTDGFDGMMLTVNFPFLDDIKNGVKFKHVIPLERGSGDTMKNDNTYKLGPFVTTTDFFRNQHITLRVKDKMTRHGTCSVGIHKAVDTMEPTEFSTAILKGSYKRATLTGAIIIKVAGGNEEGDDVEVVDEDDEEEAGNEKCVMESVDLEALEKGEIEELAAEPEPENLAMPEVDSDYEDDEEGDKEEA